MQICEHARWHRHLKAVFVDSVYNERLPGKRDRCAVVVLLLLRGLSLFVACWPGVHLRTRARFMKARFRNVEAQETAESILRLSLFHLDTRMITYTRARKNIHDIRTYPYAHVHTRTQNIHDTCTPPRLSCVSVLYYETNQLRVFDLL